MADFKEVSVDIANGKFEIYPSQDGQVRAECHVKVYRAPNEEDGKKEFLRKICICRGSTKITHYQRLENYFCQCRFVCTKTNV